MILPLILLAAGVVLVENQSMIDRRRSLTGGFALLAATGALVVLARAAVLHGSVVGSFTAEALAGAGIGGRALTMLQVVPQ